MSQEPLDSRAEPSELDAVVEYPAVSRLAVLSLLLAIGACGAVFSPLLVCLAVAGALVAIAALWSIARAQRPLLGRKAAVAALLLSVLFGVWGVTWRMVRQEILYAQAKEHADKWLQLLRTGHLREAYQLHLTQENRQAPGTDLEEFYKGDRDARFEYDAYFRGEPLRQIVETGERGQVRFLQNENVLNESYSGQKTDIVTLRYALDYAEENQPRTLTLLLNVVRVVNNQGAEAHWEMRGVQTPK